MIYRTRDGRSVRGNDRQDRFLNSLYGHKVGRVLVKGMVRPWVSRAGGHFLNSPLSRGMIRSFVRKNEIDMSQYEDRPYRSYNDFFARQIRPGMRVFDENPAHLISPCDAKLTVYPIADDSVFSIKQSRYTLETLLQDQELAGRFAGGSALVFRLTVDDFHRFYYIDSGRKGPNRRIQGVFHTVNPAAYAFADVYKENTREYCVIETDHFGTVLVMEVGALMVGRIINYHGEAQVKRGEEKGRFEFGGSTIIVLLEKDRAVIDGDIESNSAEKVETIVKAGEKIGTAVSKNDR